jgi:LysM repeat protein
MNKLVINIMVVASITLMMAGSASALNLSSINKDTKKDAKVAVVDTKKADPAKPAPPAPKIVVVQQGEYLDKIAESNQSTSLRIYYANTNISNPDLIYPNQQLRVPDATENLTPREVPVNQQIVTPTAQEATTAAAPRRAAAPANFAATNGSVWDQIAACEAGGNWAINTGNGYYGGLQFTLSSWQGVGGSGLPSNASREEQIMRGQMLQARSGWGAWPACSAKLGL